MRLWRNGEILHLSNKSNKMKMILAKFLLDFSETKILVVLEKVFFFSWHWAHWEADEVIQSLQEFLLLYGHTRELASLAYLLKFLHTACLSEIPLHYITLNVGIIWLRNQDTTVGFINQILPHLLAAHTLNSSDPSPFLLEVTKSDFGGVGRVKWRTFHKEKVKGECEDTALSRCRVEDHSLGGTTFQSWHFA